MVAPVTPEGGKPFVAQPIHAEPGNIQRMVGERLQEEGGVPSNLLEHAFSEKDIPRVSQRQLRRIMASM